MSTKYFLHGGETKNGLKDSSEFFTSLTKIDKSELNVLLVYFARTPDQWQSLSMEDMDNFLSNSDKPLNFEIAREKDFENQINWADIVYLKGGDGPRLTSVLGNYPNLKELLENKTVGAISAGANALSEHYYSRKGNRVIEGLGIIPIKAFMHYEEGFDNELKSLEEVYSDKELIKLSEGEFRKVVS